MNYQNFNLIYLIITFYLSTSAVFPQLDSERISTSINGTIITERYNPEYMRSSENGFFGCTYDIDKVTDGYRQLHNFRLFNKDKFLFELPIALGSDIEITNSGYVIFFDHSKHFLGELKIHIYSSNGLKVLAKTFFDADQFEISENGNIMGIMNKDKLTVINIPGGTVKNYVRGEKFTVDDNGFVAILNNRSLKVYQNGNYLRSIKSNLDFIRKIKISSIDDLIAVINKRNLTTYKLSDGNMIISKKINGDLSFRDLKIDDSKIIAGIHEKTPGESKGLLRIYDLTGNMVNERFGNSKIIEMHESRSLQKSRNEYDPIPWPFAPFDSMRTVWNHYEQHMGDGGGDWSYLHQGLDLIVPVDEPTYSVKEGFVKLVLTLGGPAYWRIAVSDVMTEGYSNGWLYAHLVDTTIQFDVGDTVKIHDYLGDIIQWQNNDWGHIHFVEIRDSGLEWFYNDNQWGINFNPLLALNPLSDTIPPIIESVFPESKFGFCENESSIYLSPDSLYGEIDIICKVVDYTGDSEWQQPAFKTYYWITDDGTGDTVQSRKLGHKLNHSYPFYSGNQYTPFAEVMYKRDATLPATYWNETERNYYHILTNSNGDSLVNLEENNLAFNTSVHPDGYYNIFIEVFDEAGNFNLDSTQVQFRNGNIVDVNIVELIDHYSLEQNYPNPFNPKTTIKYTIPSEKDANFESITIVTLKVFDILGREIKTLVNEDQKPGRYEIEFNGSASTSGIYFYTLRSGQFMETKKMLLMK